MLMIFAVHSMLSSRLLKMLGKNISVPYLSDYQPISTCTYLVIQVIPKFLNRIGTLCWPVQICILLPSICNNHSNSRACLLPRRQKGKIVLKYYHNAGYNTAFVIISIIINGTGANWGKKTYEYDTISRSLVSGTV